MTKRFSLLGALLVLLMAAGCGPSEDEESILGIQVYGWGPDNGAAGFQQTLPSYANAAFVQVRLTQPGQGKVISSVSESVDAPGTEIPETSYGDRLRFELSVLDGDLETIASGATPLFDFEPDDARKSFRMMVMPANDFAPVGSLVQSAGQAVFQQSTFDFRSMSSIDDSAHLGRVGHAVVPLEERNKALVVGGVDVSATVAPGQLPNVRRMHDDLQEFDPVSGYFTDLSYSGEANGPRPGGADRLNVGRAFHTVTPVGDNRFLVVGGFEQRDTGVEATDSVELIDMSKPEGERVEEILDSQGFPMRLSSARAMHTATYRPADGRVVIAGGVGPGGASDIVDTIEFIDVRTGEVQQEELQMTEARAQHSAVLMGNSTIWLVGGRDGTDALATTEKLELSGSTTTTSAGPSLNRARFAADALRISPGGGNLLMVIGGYTSLEGDVTGTYEFSSLERSNFLMDSNWKLQQARGNLRVVELPQTENLVVLSGRDSGGAAVTTSEILEFQSLSASPPYEVSVPDATSHNNRADAEVMMMSNGKIMLSGGMGSDGGQRTTLKNAEYFNPLDPITDPAQDIE
ncbi:MAG: hypothetical protein ACQEVA_07780 [Myxococcota bacterium]